MALDIEKSTNIVFEIILSVMITILFAVVIYLFIINKNKFLSVHDACNYKSFEEQLAEVGKFDAKKLFDSI